MITDELLEIPVAEAEFCALDVETTGLSPYYSRIIEIGLVHIKDMQVVNTYSTLVNPGSLIPYYITQLTGIRQDDVYDAPYFEDIASEVKNFIGNKILLGHNLSFDISFIKHEFSKCKVENPINLSLCTLRLARKIYPFLNRKSLNSVCNHLNIKLINAHRALDDAEAAGRILMRMLPELTEVHNIKSVNDLINFQFVDKKAEKKVKIKKSLSSAVLSLPHCPGIYYFLNSKNEIIYIGKAKSLKDRVKSYFSPSAVRKAKKIIHQASKLKINITNSECTALIYEAELIKKINPKHNSQLKKYGNKYFLRINSAKPFSNLEICNTFDFDGNDYFGLFIKRDKANNILDIINKAFLLRECKDKELARKRRCLLAEIERCVAPCDGENKEVYNDELEKVYEFLYGNHQIALNRLLAKMKEYSDKLMFEKAAETKALIDLILAQIHKSSLLKEPVNSAKVLFEIDEGFGKDYIALISGKIFVHQENDTTFDTALDDFYESTINLFEMPDEEDLEKMKIILNWIIRNRNSVKIFYLKDYISKTELYKKMSMNKFRKTASLTQDFDIKELLANVSNN
ncbi:MAG: exonuclease domain-containing protein [Syntrophothermus sp.]